MVVKKKRKSVEVDFGGVESGGGRPVRDGRFTAYPVSCELKESESSGNEYLAFKWKVTSGPDKGATVFDNCSLTPQALWRLKTLLEVWGEEVPDGAMDLDPDDLTGEDKEITIEITNEKYKGKDQPRITGFGGDAEEAEEEEKPSKKAKVGKKPSKKEEEEDDTDDADDGDAADDAEDEKPKKKDAKLGKPSKIKEGSTVKFEDEDGKTVRGTVTEIDGDTVKIEDKKGEEWEVPLEDVTLA